MLFKKPDDIKSSEITVEGVYLNRRNFIRAAAIAATTTATGLLYRNLNTPGTEKAITSDVAEVGENANVMLNGEKATGYRDITNYNNFYEFSTSKQAVAQKAKGFNVRPWTVEVVGLAKKARTFDMDDLLKLATQEDRIYRFRCVETWSMIIPWLGFPLSKLLDAVEPMSTAKYVQFQTLFDPERLPNQESEVLPWPYREGLRMDEAMNPLTILATGIYGKPLLPQNGAPLRLVVPWKYGFKSIKSVIRLTLIENEPLATWNLVAPDEYGFYANVNPQVSHPRWSQATENRIGEWGRRDTKMFNGYADQVASLYTGMDLRKNY